MLAPRLDGSRLQRGVILLKFTPTSRYYHHRIDIERLQRYFAVVLEPSWAGYAVPEILSWATAPEPVIVQATDAADRRFLGLFDGKLIPVPFGASDWVDHRTFQPGNETKEYDAAYVANFTPAKRAHSFFKAIAQVRRRGVDFKGALVCASWGPWRETVLALRDYYGVKGAVDIFEGLPHREVCTILNRSKCNVLLSRKEGSNKSLFEAMFADTPVILLAENVGVNKDYVNSQTGMVVREAELPSALMRMREEWERFSPRDWAMANIAPEVTTRKLTRALNAAHASRNATFDGLLVKTNSPEAKYFDAEHRQAQPGISSLVLDLFAKGAPEPTPAETVAKIYNMMPGASRADLPP